MYIGDLYVIKQYDDLGVNELAIYSMMLRYKNSGYEIENFPLAYVFKHYKFDKAMTELEFVNALEKLSAHDLLDISFFEGKISIRIDDTNTDYMTAQIFNETDDYLC